MLSLGFCAPDNDNLINGGLAVGRATWTPDGAGGGVLTVTIPSGEDCGGEELGEIFWSSQLDLTRGICGKRLHILVEGKSSTYETSEGFVYVSTAAGFPLVMSAPGGGETCGADDWALTAGDNPCDVYASCADAAFGYTVAIIIGGTIVNTVETTTTVTVTLI
jgi:hypothetical protein